MCRINNPRLFLFSILVFIVLFSKNLLADDLRVAVASNFSSTMASIIQKFEAATNYKVKQIVGSTGKLYAQIKNGAPYDIFFAADSRRPKLLEKEKRTIAGTRFTYAKGQLILWSPEKNYINKNTDIFLLIRTGKLKFRWFAIANPKLAPYGQAAKEVLLKYGVWKPLDGRLVRGENIGQTFQFIKSGNAKLGFIAYSQVKNTQQPISGSYWLVPPLDYQPIVQQAVLLKDSDAAHAFISFVQSKKILQLIRNYGYGIN